MAINVTSTANGTATSNIIGEVMLRTPTIEKGLLDIVLSQQEKVALQRIKTAGNNTVAPVATPTTAVDGTTKDEVVITVGDCMYYDEFNPIRDFQTDWSYFYSTGQLTEAQLNAEVRRAMLPTVLDAIGGDLEQLIWQGDTASGSAYLNRFDGLIKLIKADATVNDVTPAGALTASNIFATLDALIVALPSRVKERTSPVIMMNYADRDKMFQAQRNLDFKGTNITEAGILRYAGYPVITCGIPENNVVMTYPGNLRGATWILNDTRNVKIDRLQNNSELFFVKALYKFGVNYNWGQDMAFYTNV